MAGTPITLAMTVNEQIQGLGLDNGTLAYELTFDASTLNGVYNVYAEFGADQKVYQSNVTITGETTDYVWGTYYTGDADVVTTGGTVELFKVGDAE